MLKKTSRVRRFYEKTHDQRLKIIKDFSSISSEDFSLLKNLNSLDFDLANRMIENVVSTMPLPLGVAANFLINGKNYFIPMAIEESSVVAAASYAAKLARSSGGFTSVASKPIMICQIYLKNVKDIEASVVAIEGEHEKLLELANSCDPVLISFGGGAQKIVCRKIKKKFLMIHLLVDVQDAMGANIVNLMGEKITQRLEELTGGQARARIVSNLSVHRMVKSRAVWKKEVVGKKVIEAILELYELAELDPFRCATHNKGIMNGIDAVAIATGNDFRALEAGVHAYAAMEGGYRPLTKYYKNEEGDLVGELELPLAVGTVGGMIQCHPITKICLKILGVKTASELTSVMGAVGLAQNFAALRAIVSEGITKGHMRLHSKNIAITAGVHKDLIDKIAQIMIEEENISVGRAKEILEVMCK